MSCELIWGLAKPDNTTLWQVQSSYETTGFGSQLDWCNQTCLPCAICCSNVSYATLHTCYQLTEVFNLMIFRTACWPVHLDRPATDHKVPKQACLTRLWKRVVTNGAVQARSSPCNSVSKQCPTPSSAGLALPLLANLMKHQPPSRELFEAARLGSCTEQSGLHSHPAIRMIPGHDGLSSLPARRVHRTWRAPGDGLHSSSCQS